MPCPVCQNTGLENRSGNLYCPHCKIYVGKENGEKVISSFRDIKDTDATQQVLKQVSAASLGSSHHRPPVDPKTISIKPAGSALLPIETVPGKTVQLAEDISHPEPFWTKVIGVSQTFVAILLGILWVSLPTAASPFLKSILESPALSAEQTSVVSTILSLPVRIVYKVMFVSLKNTEVSSYFSTLPFRAYILVFCVVVAIIYMYFIVHMIRFGFLYAFSKQKFFQQFGSGAYLKLLLGVVIIGGLTYFGFQ